MTTDINGIKKTTEQILREHEVKHATIVGSFASGRNHPDSDIDIVIQLKEDISLLDFARIKIELEEALGRKVDLMEQSAIKPSLKSLLFKNEIQIF